MNYKLAIHKIHVILESYQKIDTDILGLERLKSELTALNVILEEIHQESNARYIQAKERLECKQADIYKKKRDDNWNVQDSTNEKKLLTIDLLKETNIERIRRDKSKGLKEKVHEVIIDQATRLKYMRNQETYG